MTVSFDILARCEAHLTALMAVPTATNRTEAASAYVMAHAQKLKLTADMQVDGSVRVSFKGKKKGRSIAYGAHLDRIGLMADALCKNGTVKISSIGGLFPRHVEEFPAVLHTEKGTVDGLIVHEDSPIHKVGKDKFAKRDATSWDKIRFRPDACVAEPTKEKLQELGVQVGDLLFLDAALRLDTPGNVWRSRWLDNTLGCAVLLGLMDWWHAEKIKPTYAVDLVFSVAEEAGMGGTSMFTDENTDFIAVDTGVGEDDDLDMKNPTILQKAGRFPYSRLLLDELHNAADKADISYDRKVLNGGGTDAEQARSAGFKGRIACVAVPLYNLHAIESCTAEAVEKMAKLLHVHATA